MAMLIFTFPNENRVPVCCKDFVFAAEPFCTFFRELNGLPLVALEST